MVTRPLEDQEKEACGFKTISPLTDTRALRHYYCYLADVRVQIGSRSAITRKDAGSPKHLEDLKARFYCKFPVLRDIDIDYSGWGWVDVSRDMIPCIFQSDPAETIWYAMGYGGNGVMYSAQAGRRMAQMVAGKGAGPDRSISTSQLPDHGILTPFRRLSQHFFYHGYYVKDKLL